MSNCKSKFHLRLMLRSIIVVCHAHEQNGSNSYCTRMQYIHLGAACITLTNGIRLLRQTVSSRLHLKIETDS